MSPRLPALAIALAALALLAAGLWGDNHWLRLAGTAALYVTLASSWNLIGGCAGYPSFATAAFFGLGAYAGAIAQMRGLPMAAAWLLAAVAGALFAALLGAALLRLRGHYFAVASLVVAEVLRELASAGGSLTGGGMGLNLPQLALDPRQQGQLFLAVLGGLAAAAVGCAAWVQRSRLGVALHCIEQNEAAASMIGIDTGRSKSAALVLSAAFAAAAGAVYANWIRYIDPTDVFGVLWSVKPIVMALLGGVGTVAGPVIGAFGLAALEEGVTQHFLDLNAAVLGACIVLLTLKAPRGIVGLLRGWGAKA